jgi:hypothetical protein
MKGLRSAGFTLIEMTVACAVSLCVFAQILFIGQKMSTECGSRCKQAGQAISMKNALTVIRNETRNSNGISPVSDGKKLMLDRGTYTLMYELVSGKIKRSKNLSAQYLTDDGEISSLAFAYPEPAVVCVTVKGMNGEMITEEAFCRNQ